MPVMFHPAANTEHFSYVGDNGSQYSYMFHTGGTITIENPDRPENSERKVRAGQKTFLAHEFRWSFKPAPAGTEESQIEGFNPENAAHQEKVSRQMKIETTPLTVVTPVEPVVDHFQDGEDPATGKAKATPKGSAAAAKTTSSEKTK